MRQKIEKQHNKVITMAKKTNPEGNRKKKGHQSTSPKDWVKKQVCKVLQNTSGRGKNYFPSLLSYTKQSEVWLIITFFQCTLPFPCFANSCYHIPAPRSSRWSSPGSKVQIVPLIRFNVTKKEVQLQYIVN